MKALKVVFLWHMHQPDYRDAESGEFVLPWVYLHAIKDYSDMAAHLEAYPQMRAVVNFVPSLVLQLDDYCQQFATGTFREPLLALLGHEDFNTLTDDQRAYILERCFHANVATMIEPFAPFRHLYEIHTRAKEERKAFRFTPDMLADLITWYHLAWIGESERRDSKLFAELSKKGQNFTANDRLRLREFVGKVITGIIPRYRALAERGQIELSATPHSHPLAPLLISFASAREAVGSVDLPSIPDYPGGAARVRAHLAQALSDHTHWFGAKPQGIWPAEGAVSEPLLKLLQDAGVRWTATSSSVLANSFRTIPNHAPMADGDMNFGYELAGHDRPTIFFRNEELSDLIGFEYRGWWASDAAKDFIARLEAIRAQVPAGETRIVSVILDGENAWEYYPYNGFYFFKELYSGLADHPEIETTTFNDYLAAHPQASRKLDRLCAGSWVYGNFLKWIGTPDKNRAWTLLFAAKQTYDLYCAAGAPPATERILRGCESSDWFWWFGDADPNGAVAAFDGLFRHNLRALYRALGAPPPPELDDAVSHGGGSPESHGALIRVYSKRSL